MGNADVGPFRFFAVASLGALSARFLLLGALSAVFDSAEPSAAAACRRMSRGGGCGVACTRMAGGIPNVIWYTTYI